MAASAPAPTTGDLTAVVAPSRTPLLIAVVLAVLLALALGGWGLLALVDQPRTPTAAADAGPAATPTPARADAAVEAPADAGATKPARPALAGDAALQKRPVQALVVNNTSDVAWSNCTVFIPGKKRFTLRALPPGFSRELPLQYFIDDPNAPVLADQVELRCAQGTATLPVRE